MIVRHDSETLKSFKGTLSEDTKKTVLEKVKKLAEDANPSILSAAVEAVSRHTKSNIDFLNAIM